MRRSLRARTGAIALWTVALLLVSLLLPTSWLIAAAALAAGSCSTAFTQAPGSPVSVGSQPRAVAVGKFNDDAIADLVVANSSASSVTILLGNGSGGFTQAPGSPVAVGSGPQAVAVGRFNGDAFRDIAVANLNGNTVTILLGDGSGGFTQAAGSPVAVGSQPMAVVVGDFNNDGSADLAVANSNANSVTILLGDGSGGFTQAAGSPLTVGDTPQSIAVGRFDADGNDDLAVTNNFSNSVSILLGNGSGGFAPAAGSPVSVQTNPRAVAVSDFDGDGLDDLAVASDLGYLQILVGDGAGRFTQPAGSVYVPTTTGTQGVAVGDFNGDGYMDVASPNVFNVTVMLGNGHGALTPAPGSPITVPSSAYSLAVGNFNGDALDDIAVASSNGSSAATILLGNCPSVDLGVTITGSPGSVLPDSDVTYTIKVTDNSPVSASNVRMTYSVPSGITIAGLTTPPDWNCVWPVPGVSTTLTCSKGTLLGGGTFIVSAHVGAGVVGPSTLTNTVTVGSDTVDIVSTNNTASASTTIKGIPTLSVDDVTHAEGNSGTTAFDFTVTLSAASDQTVTVNAQTANGTATAPADYTAIASTPITFTPGTLTRTFTVLVNGDTVDETDATFFVNLSGAVNATITRGQGLGRIQNDDEVVPTISISGVSVPEGNSGTTDAIFSVTLSAASGSSVTVQYATANGSAQAGTDYTATSGTLTFPPGTASKTIAVPIIGDTSVEPDETFTVTLSNPTNATLGTAQATGTIQNDDEVVPTIGISGASVPEGNSGTSNATFTVSLSTASASSVTVQYATANGSAQAGTDYTATSGTLTFAAGETSNAIAVPIIGDTSVEPDETFTVTLSNPTNATLGTAQATGTITNDDAVNPCAPRPRVPVMSTRLPDGRLQVTVTAGSGSLQSIQFGTATRPLQNGMVQIDGQQVTTSTTVPLAAITMAKTFTVTRTTPGQAMMVPLIVTDGCGAWETFVGLGTGS